MPYTPIVLPPGVVRGATPAQSVGRYWDANLIRWAAGVLQPVGGWERITPIVLSSITRRLDAWTDNGEIPRICAMADTKLFIAEGTTYLDATPTPYAGFVPATGGGYGVSHYGGEDYGDARSTGASYLDMRSPMWSSATWGEDMMVVASTDGRLLNWTPTLPLGLFTAVTGAPINNRAMVVTPERHVLLAGAGGERRRIAWCSREDRNDWDFASTTNTAGFLEIDSRGWMNALYPVREGTVLLTQDEVWLVRYVGQPYVFGCEKVNDTADVLSPRAVATFNGRAMWMGREAFYLFEGGVVRPVPSDIHDYIHHNINYDTARIRAHASSNSAYGECWFFYPSLGQTECDRYVIYNYAENWWSIGALERTAMCDASVYPTPLAANKAGHLFQHEIGWLDQGASRVGNVWAETGAYSIGTGDKVSKVLMAELDGGREYDATQVRVYTRFTRGGPETAHGPYNPRPDGYTEMRFTGRDLRLRFEATRDTDWTVGSVRMDVIPGGGR